MNHEITTFTYRNKYSRANLGAESVVNEILERGVFFHDQNERGIGVYMWTC